MLFQLEICQRSVQFKYSILIFDKEPLQSKKHPAKDYRPASLDLERAVYVVLVILCRWDASNTRILSYAKRSWLLSWSDREWFQRLFEWGRLRCSSLCTEHWGTHGSTWSCLLICIYLLVLTNLRSCGVEGQEQGLPAWLIPAAAGGGSVVLCRLAVRCCSFQISLLDWEHNDRF